jgi:hypothetical protein
MNDRFKIRSFIRSQFPSFVREDHSTFIAFLEAYYEWLDNNSEYIRSVSQLQNISDIDETLNLFIEDFQKTYLSSFPINLAINPETGERVDAKRLIKNIKDFYKSKGIKNSFSFLFRIFYNSDIEIYYPKNFIMNLSDGRWVSEKKIYLKPLSPSSIENLTGKTISQRQVPYDVESSLLGRARVVSSIVYTKRNNYVLELTLEELFGTFNTDQVVLDYDTGKIYGITYSVLSNITVDDQGYGYKSNQSLNFSEISNPIQGFLPKARVRRVSSGSGESEGRVLEIEITDPGLLAFTGNCELNSATPIDQNGLTGGTGFSASLIFGPLFDKKEYYIGTKGQLSSDMVLQDNYKYQEYSYVIRSDVSLSKYVDLIKGLAHPAGIQLLSEVLISKCLVGEPNVFLNIPQKIAKRIGNYLPYTFVTHDNLSSWFDGSCYATGTHDTLIIDAAITGNPISSGESFIEASSGCITADLPAGSTPDYWITLPHPNTRINQAVGYIYTNQLDDFYGPTDTGLGQSSSGWQEWNLSETNGGTTAEQEEWLNLILNSESERYFVSLNFNLGSVFRKIPIYAFLNDVSCSYDCRYSNNCIEDDLIFSGPPRYPDDYDPKTGATITPIISGEVSIEPISV